jgi:hypothetical protein
MPSVTLSGTSAVIEAVHKKCHDGVFYTHSSLHAALADNANLNHLIRVGANAAHTSFSISGGGDAYFYLYEDTTVSSNGTAAFVFNANRSSANTNLTLINEGPTITADGTQLLSALLIGGAGGNAVGGTDGSPVRLGSEIILDANTNYLLRLTNKSGQARDFSISIGWYEG